MKKLNTVLVGAALLWIISCPTHAGWSTPAAKITFYQFVGNVFWVRLDTNVTITTPNSVCTSWGNWAVFPGGPFTDYTKTWMTTVQLAVAAGHKVQIFSDSRNAAQGSYPEFKGIQGPYP